jgi:hypothetical protein
VTEVLPNLVLAGFPKCGTTSVAETLVRHPDVCGSFPHLRTRYFTPLLHDPDALLPPLESYAEHYRRWAGEHVVMDDTPTWVYGTTRIASAVRQVLGRPRVLVMLREPVARTASYLAWKKRHGELPQDLRLDDYVRRCEELGPRAVESEELNPYSGLFGSDYARYLPAWVDEFGDDLRIGYLDHMAADPLTFFRALATWLEIDADGFSEGAVRIANTAQVVRSAPAERVIRHVGRRVQPLARRAPLVYRALRDTARRVNMRSARGLGPVDGQVRPHLGEFFRPGLGELARLVHGRELLGPPGWVPPTTAPGDDVPG